MNFEAPSPRAGDLAETLMSARRSLSQLSSSSMPSLRRTSFPPGSSQDLWRRARQPKNTAQANAIPPELTATIDGRIRISPFDRQRSFALE